MALLGHRGRAGLAVVAAAALSSCAPVQQTHVDVCTPAPDGGQAAIGLSYQVGPYPETITAIELVGADGLALADARIDANSAIGASPWPTPFDEWVDGGPAIGDTLPAGESRTLALVLERTAETGTADGVLISYDSLAGAGMRAEVAMGLVLADGSCF